MGIEVTKLGVRITFTEDLLGSWPADENLFTRYVSAKAPSPWLQAEERDSLPERTQETGLTVFPCDEKGLHLFNFHVKGFLKEAAAACNHLLFRRKRRNKKTGEEEEVEGLWAVRGKLDNYVFIRPRKLYLMRDGEVITEPDDILERPLRGETAKGPRVSLVASERVKAPVQVEFVVEVIHNKDGITADVIRSLLDYGAYKGIGQWRNGGWGAFVWEELGLATVREILEHKQPAVGAELRRRAG